MADGQMDDGWVGGRIGYKEASGTSSSYWLVRSVEQSTSVNVRILCITSFILVANPTSRCCPFCISQKYGRDTWKWLTAKDVTKIGGLDTGVQNIKLNLYCTALQNHTNWAGKQEHVSQLLSQHSQTRMRLVSAEDEQNQPEAELGIPWLSWKVTPALHSVKNNLITPTLKPQNITFSGETTFYELFCLQLS